MFPGRCRLRGSGNPSTGLGHRDFVVTFDHTLPVEIDLGRRDFTINAIAMDLATGHVLDPFSRRQDLEQGILRQVSSMAFPEDPLRMLRGVQLATRFALYLEPTTHLRRCNTMPLSPQ